MFATTRQRQGHPKFSPRVDLMVSQGQQTEPALQESRFLQTGKRDFHLIQKEWKKT